MSPFLKENIMAGEDSLLFVDRLLSNANPRKFICTNSHEGKDYLRRPSSGGAGGLLGKGEPDIFNIYISTCSYVHK